MLNDKKASDNVIQKALKKLFELDKFEFDRIIVSKELIDNISEMAKQAHPKEFVAFLDGKISDKKLLLDKLTYQEYTSTKNSAMPTFHFSDKSFYGSVHSHPGYSNKPSSEDRKFFRKTGIIHAIICMPYSAESIIFYNHEGEELIVEIT
jgi:proteasome lid subunit RPN8/RPN11